MEQKVETRGRPKSFKTEKVFLEAFVNYLQECQEKDKLPNIAGFCARNDITRETYYQQREYYPKTHAKVEMLLEDAAINAKIGDSFKMFYMANKFGYRSKKEVETTVGNIDDKPLNINTNSLTVEQLRELLNEHSEG